MSNKYNFIGKSCIVVKTDDSYYYYNKPLYLTAKTKSKALNQYTYTMKNRVGFDKLIRDIEIVPYEENNNNKTEYEQMNFKELNEELNKNESVNINKEKEGEIIMSKTIKLFDKNMKIVVSYLDYHYNKSQIIEKMEFIKKNILDNLNNNSEEYRKQIGAYIGEYINVKKAPFNKSDLIPDCIEVQFDIDYLDIMDKDYDINLCFKIKNKNIGIKAVIEGKQLYNMFIPITNYEKFLKGSEINEKMIKFFY